jgi:hypothetical protein
MLSDARCQKLVTTEACLQVTEPLPGALSISVSLAVPNAPIYTLIATAQRFPPGSGVFFGLDQTAFTNFVELAPVGPPFITMADSAGQYAFSIPAGTVPSPIPTQWRVLQFAGQAGLSLSNIVTITF